MQNFNRVSPILQWVLSGIPWLCVSLSLGWAVAEKHGLTLRI